MPHRSRWWCGGRLCTRGKTLAACGIVGVYEDRGNGCKLRVAWASISCYRAIASGEGDASNEHVCSGWSSGEPLGEAKRFRHYEAESFVLIFRPHLSRLIGEYRFAEL
eukprot:scaffold48005_cov31-Tisochrysis_lutea.AAC.7